MAVFIAFYHLDPLDMTWARFRILMRAIGDVREEFRPKTAIEIMLAEKTRQIEAWKREHPESGN